MSKVNQADKEKLKALGKWGDFLAIRDELKAGGAAPANATRRALAQCVEGGNTPPVPTLERQRQLPSELRGRTASEAEIVRWCVQNLSDPAPDLADCPSPAAWSLHNLLLDDERFKSSFIRDVWGKLLPRVADDVGNFAGEGYDGERFIRLIADTRTKFLTPANARHA